MKAVDRARGLGERAAATLPGKVIRKFIADNGPNQAVLIAWNTLFAIFPIVLATATVLGLLLASAGVKADAIYQTVLAVVPDDQGRAQALAGLQAVKQRSGLFLLIALAGFIWSGSSLFGAMEQSFDLIFHTRPRPFLRQKLMGILMMVLFTVLVGIAVGTSAILPLLKYLPVVPAAWTQSATIYVVQPVVGVLAGVLLFGTLYYVVPNRRQKLKEVLPGALLAGVAFYLLTLLFPLYLSFNKGLNAYGQSFAFLFILMNFFYYLGLITMIGVELNAVLYPVPIEQPAPAQLMAPAKVPAKAKGRRAPDSGAAAAKPAPKRGARARSAVKTAVFGTLAAVIGVFAFTRRRSVGG
jgi:membrane protein